jgi:hypothetical protein
MHQQTDESTGKSISNRLRTQNVWFRRPGNIDQGNIHQNDYAIGGSEQFKGKNIWDFGNNLWKMLCMRGLFICA